MMRPLLSPCRTIKTAGAGLLLLALAACGNDPKEVSKENFARVLEAEVAGRVPCVYTSRTFPAEMFYLEPGRVRRGPEREYEALREVGLVRLAPEGADTSKGVFAPGQSIRVTRVHELTDAGAGGAASVRSVQASSTGRKSRLPHRFMAPSVPG